LPNQNALSIQTVHTDLTSLMVYHPVALDSSIFVAQ